MSEIEFDLETVPAEFWQTIAEARQDPDRFRALLKRMSRDEIVHFYWTYEALADELRDDMYWEHVDPDLSEDGLYELANWAVAQGRDYYTKVWEEPEEIAPNEDDPGLLGAAIEEFEERFGEDIPANKSEWDDEWRSHGKSSPWG